MTDFHIRQATVADATGIARVHVDSWRDTYRGIIPQDFLGSLSYDARSAGWLKILTENNLSERIFVLEDGDKTVCGFLVAGKSREPSFNYDGELHAIYLSKKLHGQGLGRLMFDKSTQACRELGLKNMFVWVLRDNPAINFYLNLKAKEFSAKFIEIGGKQLQEVALGWGKI